MAFWEDFSKKVKDAAAVTREGKGRCGSCLREGKGYR